MIVYTFDHTLDGLLSAVFDAYALRQLPDELVRQGAVLPMFCNEVHEVATTEEKASRVWAGLEKRMSREAVRMLSVSWLSERTELDTPLFHYIYKVFLQPATAKSIETNFADPDVLFVTNMARRVAHEQLRMKQFIRFQKAKDGTYLGVVAPDHNVLPLVIDHFQDRFRNQPWLIYDARRHYGYYFTPPLSENEHSSGNAIRITFENEASVPFNLENGKLNDDVISNDDQLLQDLWRTYFKAICIKERLNPRKQLNDMPRRYWKYMTEKN